FPRPTRHYRGSRRRAWGPAARGWSNRPRTAASVGLAVRGRRRLGRRLGPRLDRPPRRVGALDLRTDVLVVLSAHVGGGDHVGGVPDGEHVLLRGRVLHRRRRRRLRPPVPHVGQVRDRGDRAGRPGLGLITLRALGGLPFFPVLDQVLDGD